MVSLSTYHSCGVGVMRPSCCSSPLRMDVRGLWPSLSCCEGCSMCTVTVEGRACSSLPPLLYWLSTDHTSAGTRCVGTHIHVLMHGHPVLSTLRVVMHGRLMHGRPPSTQHSASGSAAVGCTLGLVHRGALSHHIRCHVLIPDIRSTGTRYVGMHAHGIMHGHRHSALCEW